MLNVRKWALVSVFEKRGIIPFCRTLTEAGYGILSTGGTARYLQDAGVDVTAVEEYTGFPEMMDGRVKTLHPKIHGGILGLRDNAAHVEKMKAHQIDHIDVVVVNLYPFEQTIAKPDTTFAQAVEMIDIGGPSMLRAAAKNHVFCAPVIDPDDYTWVGEALRSGAGLDDTQRAQLAGKVFAATGSYDRAIAEYFAKVDAAVAAKPTDLDVQTAVAVAWPDAFNLSVTHKQSLRYGENPHQAAHFYVDSDASAGAIAGAQQLQGKELSYNNIQDADAALSILRSLDDLNQAVVVAVKHMNPCGVGIGTSLTDAYQRAYEADTISIFGGIVACNRPVDADVAEAMTKLFLEVVMAPSFTPEARALFARKKNVRLLTVDLAEPTWKPGDRTYKRVSGGLLVQEVDLAPKTSWEVVTKRQPTEAERIALGFAWRIVRFVKSNAIVLATDSSTIGIGAGQMNRVGAAQIAIAQAGPRAVGSALASDAFFPMRDSVDTAAAAGIKAIIQPGGSIKDTESIAAADEHGIAMVFTGQRHFLH